MCSRARPNTLCKPRTIPDHDLLLKFPQHIFFVLAFHSFASIEPHLAATIHLALAAAVITIALVADCVQVSGLIVGWIGAYGHESNLVAVTVTLFLVCLCHVEHEGLCVIH